MMGSEHHFLPLLFLFVVRFLLLPRALLYHCCYGHSASRASTVVCPHQGYAPLGGKDGAATLLNHSTVLAIAAAHDVGAAAVLLRWALQHGV